MAKIEILFLTKTAKKPYHLRARIPCTYKAHIRVYLPEHWTCRLIYTLFILWLMTRTVLLVVTYWLLSLNVVNECPSLAYVVVIADKRGIVTIYACAFVVLCAGSATDLGALWRFKHKIKNNILLFVSALLLGIIGSLGPIYGLGQTRRTNKGLETCYSVMSRTVSSNLEICGLHLTVLSIFLSSVWY